MIFIEKAYRFVFRFYMAMAATSLLPAIYFIKVDIKFFEFECKALNVCINLIVMLSIPIIMSLLSLSWMKKQSDDSIMSGVCEIVPVNQEYLPVYLGYIFVSLSLPVLTCGKIDWQTLSVVYLLISIFVAFSKTLCFNPLFIVFGYGYYQVTTKNGVKVFVITKRNIRKGSDTAVFKQLHKVNELVFIDTEK